MRSFILVGFFFIFVSCQPGPTIDSRQSPDQNYFTLMQSLHSALLSDYEKADSELTNFFKEGNRLLVQWQKVYGTPLQTGKIFAGLSPDQKTYFLYFYHRKMPAITMLAGALGVLDNNKYQTLIENLEYVAGK